MRGPASSPRQSAPWPPLRLLLLLAVVGRPGQCAESAKLGQNEDQGIGMRSRQADTRVLLELEEGRPAGTLVGRIPTRANFTYRFNEQPAEFTLDPVSGAIRTAVEIDRERLASDRFDLVVLSSQPTYPIEVRLRVLDVNDNAPEFPEASIVVAFSESANVGTRVILDTASDGDAGANGLSTDYRIVAGNEEAKFRLVVTTNPSGETPFLHLETIGRLDRESRDSYTLNVSASDGGTPPRLGHLQVNVSVLDVNDNPPMFDHSDYFVSINESLPAGASVLQVRATDADAGVNAQVAYYLDSQSDFTVDADTGVLRTAGAGPPKCRRSRPDAPRSCVFTVFAHDQGSPRQDGRAYVTVSLVDANDHEPVIRFRVFTAPDSHATVDENAQNGSVVAAVSVIDHDEGPNGDTVVQIRGGNELGHFRLEPTPSFDIVRVNGVLDREKVSRYNLTVTATDRGSPPRSSTAFLLILVNDVNDHEPVFHRVEYSALLSELAPVGSFVAALTATDRDTGINARLSYAIAAGNERQWFRVDPDTGLVTTALQLDREQQDMVELKISAKDGGPNPRWAHAVLRVQILDENDQAPAFALPVLRASLPENAEPGSLVSVLSAADGDLGANGSVSYSLDSQVELSYPGVFQMDPVHGRLTAKRSLDREDRASYNVLVVARDEGSPPRSSTATVQINVVDVDDHRPRFYPTQYFVELADGASPGSFVCTVTATDGDEGVNALVAYSVLGGAQGRFRINDTSGQLITTQELRLEHQARYEIQVAARSPNGRDADGQDTALVVVFVREPGKALPLRFHQPEGGYNLVTDESGPESHVGRELGRVSLERSEHVDRARFSIVDGDPWGWFRLDPVTGILTTAAPLDRERSARVTLDVVANTLAFFARTSVTVTLDDVNDNAPHFVQPLARVSVVESWPTGLELYVPEASDADAGINAELEYSLASGPNTMFAVEPRSGMLRLLRPLRLQAGREFALELAVTDKGRPRLTSRQQVLVQVEDVNDHTPTFERPSYETSLLELTPVNERFFTLRATDADSGDNGRVSYEITEGNQEGRFGVFPDGAVYVKKALDREWRDLYALTVRARDHGERPRWSAVSLLVHVLDENDNAPVFDNATFIFTLAENEPPDTHVGKLTAEDGDRGRNAELTFSLASNENDFAVDPRTGFIRTLRYFDREKLLEVSGHDTVSMDALVLDSGITRLRGEAKVLVRILDVNDNAPLFSRSNYRASVSEAAPLRTTVVRVSAVDVDQGASGDVLYGIAEGNDQAKFSIDEATGQLSVVQALDREQEASYTLTVVARDTGLEIQHTSTATVLIQVLDENDNAPEFSKGPIRADILETTPVGYELHRFKASDRDMGLNGEVTFSIASGNVKEVFKVDSVTGVLYLDRPLDFEQQSSYLLNVTASDGGSPRQATVLAFSVRVLDVNDNPPQFANVAIVRQIEEGLPLETPVVTVTAVDRDATTNGKITYSITAQEPPGSHFGVRPDTGVVFTTADIDREFSDTFRLTLTATDHGTPSLSSNKTVTIIVEDINDNAPAFVSVDAGVLPEDSDKGYVVMRLEALDADTNANGQVTYELVDGDKNLFVLDRITGELSLSRAVGRPSVSYSLAVQASDQAVPSQRRSSRAQLTVLGASNRPQATPSFSAPEYSASVHENQPAGTSVISVRAEARPEARILYFLTSVRAAGVPAGRRFAVHRDTGLVTTAVPLDREAGSDVFELELLAVDAGAKVPRTAKTTVTVMVLDRNDSPPHFQNGPYIISLSEDAPVGSTVAILQADDPDLEGSVRFSISESQADSGRFQVNPQSGTLVLVEPLDREQQSQHQFFVTATDGLQSEEALVTIEVMDTNDNLPMFGEIAYSFDLWEDAQRGAQVGAVSATDADLGLNRQVSYSVLSDWANNVFSLNPQTGVFTLTSHLDYEQYQHYVLVVQAQDSGTPSLSSTATVYMNVLDLNDNAPLFDPMSYSDEVFENVTVGSSLLRVSATDLDSGDNGRIVYSIAEGDAEGQLAILANGTIVTRLPLDRESKSLYSLIVRATDQAMDVHRRLSSSVQVTIVLKDVNDMVPEFVTPNITSVQENAPANSIVMAVKAVDRDEGRNSYVEYSLSPEHTFSLGPVDGLLRVRGPLDREQRSSYELLVTARDRGHPVRSASQRLRVQLLDENDNSPVFDPRQYSAAVSENASVGASVLQVSATDQDEGASGQVRYSIIAGDPNHDFEVGQDTGVLRVRRALDYERKTRYLLTLQAEDCAGIGGAELRFDTATVTVAVTDVNDNAPTFLDSPYELHVVENAATPTVLLTLSAHDADQLPSGPMHYRLEEGGHSTFRINSSSGELTLARPLDREFRDRYLLTVLAIDSGSPRQTGTGTVVVLVSDVNDNAPQFERSRYIASLAENQPADHPVTCITATDADIGTNAQIRYSLRGEHGSRFSVDPKSGVVRARVPMDREERERYELQLVAEDGGLTLRHSSSAQLVVFVKDQNDNRPIFANANMTVVMPDSAEPGYFVLGAEARDADAGPNGQLVFHMSGPDADKFQIEQDTGVVRLAHRLTSGQQKDTSYQLNVHAMDQGQVPLSSTATIRVLTTESSLFPKFRPGTPRELTLAEKGVGRERVALVTLSAISPKTGAAARISYRIAGGNNQGAFALDPASGVLTVARGEALDLESAARLQLWLEASDGDQPALSSAFRLDVRLTDINDNVPTFEQDLYNTSVREEQPLGQLVARLHAHDADGGDNGRLRYMLHPFPSSDDNEELPFELDSTTGELRTTARLDRERVSLYRFLVEAKDHGDPSLIGTATVLVSVSDKNDNPPRFTRLFSVNVTENAPLGSFVIQVTSSDRDAAENANATYSFTENPGERFAIDPLSGNVTVAGPLDRELRDEYLLKVAAVDGSWKAETPLTVSLQDMNDNSPRFLQSVYRFRLPELQQSGAFIGRVAATDADKAGPNAAVSYSLRRPSDLFRIDPATGELLSKQLLHYRRSPRGTESPENQHMLRVLATDHGKPPLSSEATVYVNIVDDNNHMPKFYKQTYFSPLPENAAVGLSVLQVTAKDDEDVGVNAELLYSIVDGNGTDLVAMHPTSGWLTVAKPLPRHQEQIFTVRVRATDQGVPPKTADALVSLAITTKNKFSPVFTALGYQIIIPENEPVHSELLTVSATDADSGLNGKVCYAIESGNTNDSFAMDPQSGALTISQVLDYETRPEFRLNVSACDGAFRPKCAWATLTVIITDINDCAPKFNASSFSAYITENEPPGTVVTQLSASDADSGRNRLIQYALVGTSDFTIDSQSGLVVSLASFDYEQASEYVLQVVATNPGSLQYSSCQLHVHVTGKNEFYPRFVQPVFQFAVSESTVVGTAVGRVLATDEDSGPEGDIYFLFVGSSNDRGFRIQPNTGVITVARTLDREAQARVVLSVMAKNAGSIRGNDTDEAQVVISIQDGNDPPVFLQPVYEARISEAIPVGSSVVAVSAVDRDVRPNNHQFSYSILDGDPGKLFSIDAQTGLLQTVAPLDREAVPVHVLTLAAIDHGSPPQTGSTTVHITLDDVNDNGPELEPADLLGYILEDEPPYTSVLTLAAKDRDLAPNGAPFAYSLVSGTRRNLFELDRQTGLLRTTQRLDREATPSLQLLVEVQDSGNPPIRARHTLTVLLVDKNDSPSAPRSLTVLVWVYRSLFAGGKIADVRPLDPDATGEYQCRLENRHTVFAIVSHCDLHASRLLSPSNYSFTVRGNDGYHQDVTSTINVQFRAFDNDTVENSISLRIVNQSAHHFLSTSYDRFLGVLSQMLEGLGLPIVYSMVDMTGQLQMTLAVRKPSGAYLSSEKVTRRLESRKDTLQAVLAKTVLVGYEPCASAPCQHGGTCHSFLDLQPSLSILDSPQLVFSSPSASRSFSCSCPSGFSGRQCQEQLNPCSPSPCADGAPCQPDAADGFRCLCPPDRQGVRCEMRREDSCASGPCKNGGSCREAPDGSFFCLCRLGFKGSLCELATDGCRPSRCRNGGTCISDGPAGYRCMCEPNFFGKHCEKSTYGFQPYSYMAFPSLKPSTNDISIVFSTNRRDALLAYNFGAQNGGRSDFVALEIVHGKPQFSFGGSRTAVAKVSLERDVADGDWHRVTVIRNGRVASLSVVTCQDHGELCEECSHANSSCSLSVTGQAGTLSLSSQPLYIGGLPSVEPLLERPSQVAADDFVGCVHSVAVDGQVLAMDAPLRSQHTVPACGRKGDPCTGGCKGATACNDLWFTASCACSGGSLIAHNCGEALEPYSLASGSFLELVPQEKHRRAALLLQQAKRTTRSLAAAQAKTVSLRMRTRADMALLLHVATERDLTRLQLVNGHLEYFSQVNQQEPVRWRHRQRVSDGSWHDVVLSRMLEPGGLVTLAVDGHKHQISTEFALHDFLDPFLTSFTIGGRWEQNSLSPGALPGFFQGCVQQIAVNGELQSLNASQGYFHLVARGTVGHSCNQEGLDVAADPLGVGIILVIAFFVVLILVILVSLLVFRRCKLMRHKSTTPIKSNGSTLIGQLAETTRTSDHREPADITPSAPEELLRSPPSAQDLVLPKRAKERGSGSDLQQLRAPQRPDIIERETAHTSSPLAAVRCPEQSTYGTVEPEHYDLENASSIAPSDIDIVYHYRVFRDGSQLRKLHKGLHKHPGPHRHSPLQASPTARQSPRQQLLLRPAARDSPSALKMHSTPLARLSPSSELSRQTPRILTLQDISGKPLQTALLASAHPGGGPKPFKDPLTNSERSLNSPVSQLSRSTGSLPSAKLKQACAPAVEGHCGQPLSGLGLTAEEIECLNARPRNCSLVSTLDAVSSSGSEGTKGKLSQLLDERPTALLDAATGHDSSSDESGNDSFTCSEFEYDNGYDKAHRDFAPGNMIFSKLAEEDNENDEDSSKTYDGFDSFRGSLSTLVASDDDLSHLSYKPPSGAVLGWDCLLNWGPNFENLVGVFKDIADLPDTVSPLTPGHPKPSEEYV